MPQFFDKAGDRLVYLAQAASSEFWDGQWRKLDIERVARTVNHFVQRWTRRYLPAGSRVLEGGCGMGGNVHTLQRAGYDCYGIDYAAETVAGINRVAPDLKVTEGDVRALPFADGFFDGYWSLGVIEHFFDGFEPIRDEMARVIRPGGFLFLTFPTFSPLRRWKALRGAYPPFIDTPESRAAFYQFALSPRAVGQSFAAAGFSLRSAVGFDATKGLKDEVPCLNGPLRAISRRGNPLTRTVARGLEITGAGLAPHMSLLVLKRV